MKRDFCIDMEKILEVGKFLFFDFLINFYFLGNKIQYRFYIYVFIWYWNMCFYRDVVVYVWDNIWEYGNGDNVYILVNNDYKV